MAKVGVRIRAVKDRDIDFIVSSWLQSMRTGGYMSESVPNTVFFRQHHRIIEKLVPQSLCLVACNEEDEDQIFGWVCAQLLDNFLVIHYVYTKNSFRRFGIAHDLVKLLMDTQKVDQSMVFITHQTRQSRSFQVNDPENKGSRLIKGIRILYSPYLLMQILDGSDWWK